MLFQKSLSFQISKESICTRTMDTYRFRFLIWNGASIDNIVWKGS